MRRLRPFGYTVASRTHYPGLDLRFGHDAKPSDAEIPSPNDPVGVFDSGVGGLSVLREIRRQLPAEDLIYVADSAHAPYGERSPQEIVDRAVAISEALLEQRAKAIVVACNTATGAAVQFLRGRYALPIVAMEPALKPAVASSRSGVVAILATSRTLASHKFVQLLGSHGGSAEVLVQPCPGLVERVEKGDLTGAVTRALLQGYLEPLLRKGADTIVLGCTHYPHLRGLIEAIAGPGVVVVDSGAAVARQLGRRLVEAGLLRNAEKPGKERILTSGRTPAVRRVIAQLWAQEVTVGALAERGVAGATVNSPAAAG